MTTAMGERRSTVLEYEEGRAFMAAICLLAPLDPVGGEASDSLCATESPLQRQSWDELTKGATSKSGKARCL